MAERLPLFATTSRGTEELLASELEELGAAHVRRERGGVRFHANLDEALRIALWTRIAMRVLYPVGEATAEGKEGLYDAASSVPWEEYLTVSTTFAVEATLRDTEHTHSGFVALKIKDAIVDRLRQKLGARPDVSTSDPDVQVVAHLVKNHLSLSLDVCGQPLYRRGYRVRTTPAPLKETLAAAMLRAAGYKGEEPLLDPMCGSGTLLLEAAQVAAHRPPSLGRTFSMSRWPGLREKATQVLEELTREAQAGLQKPRFPILGMDKDPDALDAADANVAAARLVDFVELAEGDATHPISLPTNAPGVIASNPPYGERIGSGGQKGMKAFYFKLGENLRTLSGWRVFLLAGNPSFESAYGQRPRSRRALWNGPIACTLLEYENP